MASFISRNTLAVAFVWSMSRPYWKNFVQETLQEYIKLLQLFSKKCIQNQYINNT